MFYTATSCLDCFDDIRDYYKDLPYDLEYENKITSQLLEDNKGSAQSSIKISVDDLIKNENKSKSNKKNCC